MEKDGFSKFCKAHYEELKSSLPDDEFKDQAEIWRAHWEAKNVIGEGKALSADEFSLRLCRFMSQVGKQFLDLVSFSNSIGVPEFYLSTTF